MSIKKFFALCCYDMMQDKIFYTQKLEPDYYQSLKHLTFVRKALRKDVDFECGYELTASNLLCIIS